MFARRKNKIIFIEERNAQNVSAPVIICWDIYDQIYDLIELFKKGGEMPSSKYVFMVDYIVRGYRNIKITISYKNKIFWAYYIIKRKSLK